MLIYKLNVHGKLKRENIYLYYYIIAKRSCLYIGDILEKLLRNPNIFSVQKFIAQLKNRVSFIKKRA